MENLVGSNLLKYTHVPLKPGFFRLFRLVEDRFSPDLRRGVTTLAQTEAEPGVNAPLRVQCVESRFENPICYEALSYCWAGHERSLSPEERDQHSQLNRHVLVTDGGKDVGFLPISASLETAMLHLRPHTNKPLFIDQLCINQADNAEKGRLVRRMGEIYSKAKRVLAWLGPSTPEAEKFISFMKHLEETAPPPYLRLVEHDYPTLEAIRGSISSGLSSMPVPGHLLEDRDMLRDLVIEVRDEIPLRGFVDVCSRQYFGRMWIVQEACLAGSLYFVCGHNTWHAVRFERALLFFFIFLAHRSANLTHEDVAKEYPKVDDIIFAVALCRFVNRLFTTRRTIRGADQARIPLFRLLAKFNVVDTVTSLTEGPDLQKFRAGDPRDCYYSLLALPETDDTAVKRVVVSYDKSAQEVFTELAEALVANYTDVLLFSQNASKRLKGLPSWVPDWSSQLASPFGYFQSNIPLFAAGCAERSQNWPGASEPYVDGPMLVVIGRPIDIVHRIGEYVYQTTDSEDKPAEVSQHYFLSEIELFCRLARQEQATSPASPPCLEDAPWLLASGGRGLATGPEAGHDGKFGPEIQGVRLLDAAYQIWRQYLERHTKKRELTGWQNRRSEVLGPLEERWLEWKKRTGLYRGLMYWLGFGTDWTTYEFCEKFNEHWDKFGPMAGVGVNDAPDGWNLPVEVREEALKVTGLLGRAMDMQQGRRCFVTPKGYVGLGPLDMQAGDVVAILKGGSVPVVLRSHFAGLEGRQLFTHVGEAYCYGTMDGELLDWQAGDEPSLFRII
jgi:hypothetical protein